MRHYRDFAAMYVHHIILANTLFQQHCRYITQVDTSTSPYIDWKRRSDASDASDSSSVLV